MAEQEGMTEQTAQRLVASLNRLSEALEQAQLKVPSLHEEHYSDQVARIIVGGPEELRRLNKQERSGRRRKPGKSRTNNKQN